MGKIIIPCKRFGSLERGRYAFNNLPPVAGFENPEIDIQSIEEMRSALSHIKECDVAGVTVDLIRKIQRGAWKYGDVAWVAASSSCHGCSRHIQFSVEAKRKQEITSA